MRFCVGYKGDSFKRFVIEHLLSISTPPGRNFARKAAGNLFRRPLFRVFTWAEIEPIYGQPWVESVKIVAKARSEAAKLRRGS